MWWRLGGNLGSRPKSGNQLSAMQHLANDELKKIEMRYEFF